MDAAAKAKMKPLRDELLAHSVAGKLWRTEPLGIRCYACGHRCLIPAGRDGICKVRFNDEGVLKVPFNYVGALQVDPIEKKPFFHALPGSRALSFGMLGCDFHCGYCQNWFTSQALRDVNSAPQARAITADALVDWAARENARTVTSTYNEPLISAEWAVEVLGKAKARGLYGAFVSNGNGTPEVLDFIRPYVDFYKIDLKSFRDKPYRSLGGVLSNVTDTIRRVHALGMWLEVVTLIIPGFNDDPQEIKELCEFLVSVSPDIPWHASAYHKDYKMRDPENTSVGTLIRAAEIATEAGLRYVYLGNLPGQVGRWENTRCPGCGEDLIVRHGFRILSNRIQNGACPTCQTKIPGIWK